MTPTLTSPDRPGCPVPTCRCGNPAGTPFGAPGIGWRCQRCIAALRPASLPGLNEITADVALMDRSSVASTAPALTDDR